jgi:hypothetical protein
MLFYLTQELAMELLIAKGETIMSVGDENSLKRTLTFLV